MDTTIRNLDDEAYRRIKSRAALEGRTLGEAVSEAIRRYVAQDSAAVVAERVSNGAASRADEVAEAADRRGVYLGSTTVAAGGDVPASERHGPPPPTAAPTLTECLARLAELSRADPEYLDELEAIQAAQPRPGSGAWDS
jgi:plasmid stability protein